MVIDGSNLTTNLPGEKNPISQCSQSDAELKRIDKVGVGVDEKTL